MVQAAQCVEGGVRVLLHKQVPRVDLVDHDHLHGDTIREHELWGEGAAGTAAILLRFRLRLARGHRPSL